MKVQELISYLKLHDPNSEIICLTEEEEFLVPGHGLRLFDIHHVDKLKGRFTRGSKNLPTIKLQDDGNVENIVILEITGDF